MRFMITKFFFSKIRTLYGVMCKNIVEQDGPQVAV
jgi:hypothetical protein